jgi:excisionase family DNA binding protein|uniref:DNA-binding protein n=1 Tax=Hydrogenobacter sp. TaxID=2152829 RepID=A0A7C2ZH66_9AQUI
MWMTVKEASEYLRVHPNTIRRWVAKGLLREYRLNRKVVRYRKEDLDALFMSKPKRGRKPGWSALAQILQRRGDG